MSFLRTSLLSGVAVSTKMGALLLINKVLALYMGPAGFAIVGQLQNIVGAMTSLSSASSSVGVTKYTSEYSFSFNKQREIWRSAVLMSLCCSVLCAAILIIFRFEIASYAFAGEVDSVVLVWLAICLFFSAVNLTLLAVLNGQQRVGLYSLANIFGSLLSALLVLGLTSLHGIIGGLIAVSTYQAFALVATLCICLKCSWFRFSNFFGRVSWSAVGKLSKFSLMALVSAICAPIAHMLIRSNIGDQYGWEFAGYWEAASRLSAAYLMFITTTLSVYFLPRLASISNAKELSAEILSGYKVVLPLLAISGIFIYLSRDFLIAILFSADFYAARELFLGQVIGDFLKMAGWLISYVLLARALVWQFIVAEIVFTALYVALALFFLKVAGWEGVMIAYVVNYTAYWLVVYFLLNKSIGFSLCRR
ncbi:O-antigen translocase [Pseudomonas sp. URMO17WK12:I2]|uniref:O-antigen translocase n=1 Tax=Pseudomonas sp. URMO17WK12:I2 TaxID=1261623 RepID=UPI000DAC862D|nr:O-antigen translocase [Pseudomonas sp. URMO17WK12:I2]PZW43404.1 PST family polysaccharide transporter [Pseudomonas sp. URMO17WK12:I2]